MRGSNDLDFTSLRTVSTPTTTTSPRPARVAVTLSSDGKGSSET
jgi:hypothetical protein